jgi:zinc transport system substrate-binding protein
MEPIGVRSGNVGGVRPLALITIVLAFAVLTSTEGCKPKSTGRPRVVVSIFPIYDLVRRVAGPDADVTLLLPPGKNEHTFDPTPHEIEEVAKSKLGVMVGLGLDPWMEKMMKDAAPTARVLKVGDRVPTLTVKDDPLGDEEAHAVQPEEDHDHDKGAIDPHVWLDPQRARLIVKAIGEDLSRVDAAHANAYRQRTSELDAALDALDKEVEAKTATWKKREIITFHGSFAYFAERYHHSIGAVTLPFPGSTPTGKYIEQVLKVVSAKKVPALFSEPQLDPRPAQILATQAKIPLGVLDPVGGGPETDSYEKMIRFDVAALTKALE